jgi:uncharacterized protein YjbI with pentapeptide repeats
MLTHSSHMLCFLQQRISFLILPTYKSNNQLMRKLLERAIFSKEGANSTLILLKNSVAEFNDWRIEHPRTLISFTGEDFTGLNLREANLSGVDIRDADFRYADLTNAKLTGTDIRGAKFQGAVLIGIDIPLSKIENIDLHETTITRSQFEEFVASLEKSIMFKDKE